MANLAGTARDEDEAKLLEIVADMLQVFGSDGASFSAFVFAGNLVEGVPPVGGEDNCPAGRGG